MFVGIDADKVPAPRHLASVLGGVLAGALAWHLLGPPTAARWWLVLLPAATVAAVAVTAVAGTLLGRLASRWVRLRPLRRRAVVTPPAVTAVMLAGAGAVAAVVGTVATPPARCDQPVELRILASSGSLVPARELAEAYERWTVDDAGCPGVSTYAYEVPPDTARSALESGWGGTVLRDVGPRPDVWIPRSFAEVGAVRDGAAGSDSDLLVLEDELVAVSPLVLAAHESVAGGAARYREGHTWVELLALADSAGWQPARLDPTVSVTDDLVTTALYGSVDDQATATALAREIEPRIAQALDRGEYPLTDPDAFLCHHRQRGAGGATTVLLTTEQAMVRLNRGEGFGGQCAAATGGPPPGRLLAFYPSDTLTVDHTVVSLAWRGATQTPQARAASGFRRWLTGDAGREALVGIGLRPAGSPLTGATPLSPEHGVRPAALAPVSRPPDPVAVALARSAHRAAQRPGVVLLGVDISGSMSEPVDAQRSRYDVARRGVEEALRLLGDQDEFGLWVFPAGDGARELVPIGPADEPYQGRSRREAALAGLAAREPGGPTPLYRTIVDGVAAVGPADGRVAAVVVLTDGEDSAAGADTGADVRAALERIDRGRGVRVFVVAVGEASCRVDALAGVTARTGGECIGADFAGLPDQLVDLFGVLWSGGGDDAA